MTVDVDALRALSRDMQYGDPAVVAAGIRALRDALDEIEQLHAALTKISAIRDSIVGMQGFNFSEHAYPLVAALGEAGFEGAGYEISRKNLGTLLERNAALEAALTKACSLLDDAVQLRRDADRWFPIIAELRKLVTP